MIDLDFDDYPNIVEGDIFWRAPPDKLKTIPHLYDHAASCLHMLGRISDYKERAGFPPELHVAACVRAALVEFVAIEETIQSAGYDFSILKLRSPLLHFMRLLRNYQIHIASHPISKRTVEILFAGREVSMEVPIIDNLDAREFMELSAIARHRTYTFLQVQTMIDLFNVQQARLGVYEILRRGAQRLIAEVQEVF